MRLRLIAAPTVKPVTTAEARTHVEAYGTAHDAKLSAMIDAAIGHMDGNTGILGRALIEQEWEASLDAFPTGTICLPLPPLRSVPSVKYTDTTGVEQTLAPAAYVVDLSEPGTITPAFGMNWPATRSERNAVRIRFRAGYGTAATDVPQGLRSAILLHVGALFENREREGAQVFENHAYDDLVFPFLIVLP